MRPRLALITIIACFILFALPQPDTSAKDEGAIVEGTGYTLYDVESIQGSDEAKIDKDPVCDRSKQPKIVKVEPDEAKPGQHITIKGEHFGKKNVSTASPSAPPARRRLTTRL